MRLLNHLLLYYFLLLLGVFFLSEMGVIQDEYVSRISLKDLDDDSKLADIRSYLLKGNSETMRRKLQAFRIRLHDLLLYTIKGMQAYDEITVNDVDAQLITGNSTNLTPDLYDKEYKIWGDVTITRDVLAASEAKFEKYKVLLEDGEHRLFVYAFSLVTYDLYTYTYTIKGRDSNYERCQLDREFSDPIIQGLTLYNSARQFDTLEDEEDPKVALMENLHRAELCPEALSFHSRDGGLLNDLLSNFSSDSTDLQKEKFRKKRELELNIMASKIAREAKEEHTPFKPTDSKGITKALQDVELEVEQKYKLMQFPKPSCHGMPGTLTKVQKGVPDTRHAVVTRFNKLMANSRVPVFQEIHRAIQKNIEELRPKKLIKIKELQFELPKLKRELDRLEVLSANVPENGNLNNYQNAKKIYDKKQANLSNLEREQTWDRESLRFPRNSEVERVMRIGKISKAEKEVKTVPFWDKLFSDLLKAEIVEKVGFTVAEEHCWTPHKEYKPKTKEAGILYNAFIRTKLYQEIAQVGQLASNILRLVTKPRKHSSITTGSTLNMAAIVGPGDSAMNESCTVPIIWLSLGRRQQYLWMPPYASDNYLHMSNGDRLTKARLEQMVDASRIASIAASIICCELTGPPKSVMYACGVMASIAMSISIRDSELIDHIRYMIPNIFSERSCAEDYIRDKYATPLKTRLQALIYQETKLTLLQSSEIIKEYYEVKIENDEIMSGGVKMKIPFLDCHADSVFQLNGVVYTGFFSCKKGLHEPRIENKKMFDKICEYEYKNFQRDLVESSFDKESYHYFNPKYVAYTMSDMVDKYATEEGWRSRLVKMDNLKKPYELKTFSSLHSSLKTVQKLKGIRMLGVKSKLNSVKRKKRASDISEGWEEIWSDNRTRVVDQFFDLDKSILQEGVETLTKAPLSGFYATWDQKRQRTGRDREVFILDPSGKVFMHNVESLFKVVCEGVPQELITLPGNKKIIAMNIKGAQYFKKINELKKEKENFERLRVTADMTKWAPGDNVCKFIYAIASLPFLTQNEKIWYINFLCTSLRKKVVLNSVATDAIGSILVDGHLAKDEMWAKMLGISETEGLKCKKLKRNYLDVRFNWLMGVLNDTSSAVHAACAHMLERVLSVDYNVLHYEPDVHSDDAAADLIVQKKRFKSPSLIDYFPKAFSYNLKQACIKVSEKKTYLDYHRKEFVSEVDDNGLLKSYWHKQAIAAISGMSYIDFYRDLSEASSKVANLIALGGPPTVYEVTLSNVIDLSRDTYSMQPGMWNDPMRFLKGYERDELPLELGGSLDMNPILLPITGMKYHTFRKMMVNVLTAVGKQSISDITEDDEDVLKNTQGNLFCKVWLHTTEAAVRENLILDRLDSGMIKFKQFASFDKVKDLRVMETLAPYDKEYIDNYLEQDPTLVFRQPANIEEQQLKLAMLIKNPAWYSSATLQSQGALKLDRMFNVKSPCCAPILDPDVDSVMEKGMKTIREAITEAVQALEKRKVSLYEVVMLLKSMPLMCYIYDIEHKLDFREGGKRQLFPVQKEAFLKDSIIESNVVGLLQYKYTGSTDLSLDRANLEEELELVEKYQNALMGLDKIQQAVAIYRMFQQNKSFSSVFFVSSPRLKGHDAILGVLGNQYSDKRNWIPKTRFAPPESMMYKELRLRGSMSLESKCSELACFLMKVANSKEAAQEAFLTCEIEGIPVTQIIDTAKNKRQIAYALALLDRQDEMLDLESDEVVWIQSQRRGFPGWSGPFLAYMNTGTKRFPKGMLIKGENDLIEELYFFGDAREYTNLKTSLNIFRSKMKWKGSLEKHVVKKPFEATNCIWSVIFHNYGCSFQTKLQKESANPGLPVYLLRGGLEHPRMRFVELTRSGIGILVEFRGQTQGTQIWNTKLTQHFEINTSSKLGIVPVKYLWDEHWYSISNRFTIMLDDLYFLSEESRVYLSNNHIDRLNSLGYECEPIAQMRFSYDDIMNDVQHPQDTLDPEIFQVFIPWTTSDYNFYMSLALHSKSKLLSWVSWKGNLSGKALYFRLISKDVLETLRMSAGHKHYHAVDTLAQLILEHSQGDRELQDDIVQKNLDSSCWSTERFKGFWSDYK